MKRVFAFVFTLGFPSEDIILLIAYAALHISNR